MQPTHAMQTAQSGVDGHDNSGSTCEPDDKEDALPLPTVSEDAAEALLRKNSEIRLPGTPLPILKALKIPE